MSEYRVYQPAHRAGKRRGVFFCASCCDESHKAGKFHAPVMVPADDLQGKNCGICNKPIVCPYLEEMGWHLQSSDGHCVGCCHIDAEWRAAYEKAEKEARDDAG